jgi:hypothetical protein
MSGIGRYAKGKKFELRSGNTPSGLKALGATENGNENVNEEEASTKTDSDKITDSITEPKVNKTKTFANKVGNALIGSFTSGLDAVYGSGRIIPGNKVKFHNPKKKDEKTGSDKVDELLG